MPPATDCAVEETEVNPKILLRVTAPAVVIGVLLFAACVVGVFYVTRLQANVTDILSRDVASLQAAQELQIRVRQLRFHNLLYLMQPGPAELGPIADDERRFEEALETARQASRTQPRKKNGFRRLTKDISAISPSKPDCEPIPAGLSLPRRWAVDGHASHSSRRRSLSIADARQ